jgi:hypothetical protein
MKLIFIYTLLLVSVCSVQAQRKDAVDETVYFHRAQQALTDVIVHDVFSPPVAARIYAYPNMVAYEVLVRQQKDFGSLKKVIPGFPGISEPGGDISYSLAAVAAFLHCARAMIFSEKMFDDSANAILGDFSAQLGNKKKIAKSMAYGRKAAEEMMKWAALDQYSATRSLRRYTLRRGDGMWIPTPPAYMAAVEPYWGRIRPLMIDSVAAFRISSPAAYSIDTSTLFYRQATEVYHTVKNLDTAQRNIALFWDCNPFFVNVSGHLVFATKKLSPGGHWLSIAGQAAKRRKLDIMSTSAAYMYTTFALYDGFVVCWDEKYRSNYIRPETYINARIDESWRPLLQTPPFPEYPSGHSVISTAAACVLTAFFGDNFAFADSTEVKYGLPVRNFNSFYEASQEAAVSRLYGGIHFREAIVNGQEQGQKVGEHIVRKLGVIKR